MRITQSILAALLSGSLPAVVESTEPLAGGAMFALGSARLQVRIIPDPIARIRTRAIQAGPPSQA